MRHAISTYQANDAALAISAGANHVLLVHRSGQLYTWGVGASGRLGLDLSQGGNPQVKDDGCHQRRLLLSNADGCTCTAPGYGVFIDVL